MYGTQEELVQAASHRATFRSLAHAAGATHYTSVYGAIDVIATLIPHMRIPNISNCRQFSLRAPCREDIGYCRHVDPTTNVPEVLR